MPSLRYFAADATRCRGGARQETLNFHARRLQLMVSIATFFFHAVDMPFSADAVAAAAAFSPPPRAFFFRRCHALLFRHCADIAITRHAYCLPTLLLRHDFRFADDYAAAAALIAPPCHLYAAEPRRRPPSAAG